MGPPHRSYLASGEDDWYLLGIARPSTGVPLRPLRSGKKHRKKAAGDVSSYSPYGESSNPSRPATGALYGGLPVLSRPTTGAIYGKSPAASRPGTYGSVASMSRPATGAVPSTAAASRPRVGADDDIFPPSSNSAKLTAAHEVSARLAELDRSVSGAWKQRRKLHSRNATPYDNPTRRRPLSGSATPKKDLLQDYSESAVEVCTVPIVVEAPMSLTIMAGGETQRVWPHTWLVIDSTTTIEAAGGCLHPEAGGGSIVEEHERTLPLRRVADHRLNSKGAEANFQRSARSASLMGLKHAAMVLRLFGNREKYVTSSGSLAPMDPVPEPDPFRHARVNERVRKLESIVAFRAATATQRAASSGEGEAILLKTSRLPALSQKPTVRQSANQKGLQALEQFTRFAEHRYGNTVRTWFMLDPEGKMAIGEKQFARACDEIGFSGNVVALWRYLDSDQSGQITILELDNVAAVALAEFKQVIRSRFQDSASQAFMHLDENRSDRLFKMEFVKGMQSLGFKAPAAAKLFCMFDKERLGSITSKDVLFLDRWHPPPYLFVRPDLEALDRFKHALRSIYKSLLRAWRQVLDKDSTMRVSWDEFVAVCKLLEKHTALGIPKTQEQMAGVWRALDEDCGGWIALRELDRESFESLAGFKCWSMRNHGAVCTAFQVLSGSNAKLSQSEIPNIEERDYKFDGHLFIQGLNLNNNVVVHKKPDEKDITKVHIWEVPFLVEKDVRFLDRWDLDWEDQETDAKHGHNDSNVGNAFSSARTGG